MEHHEEKALHMDIDLISDVPSTDVVQLEQPPLLNEHGLECRTQDPSTSSIQSGCHTGVRQIHRQLLDILAQRFGEACVTHIFEVARVRLHEAQVVVWLGAVKVHDKGSGQKVLVRFGMETLGQGAHL